MSPKVKKKNITSKIEDDKIELMKKFRMNGASYDQISDACGVSMGSVSKYCKGVQMLPKSARHNMLEPLREEVSIDLLKSRDPNYLNILREQNLNNVEFILDSHVDGMRFADDVPEKERLQLIFDAPLAKLQKTMRVPTDYHSPLNIWKWCKHYLA